MTLQTRHRPASPAVNTSQRARRRLDLGTRTMLLISVMVVALGSVIPLAAVLAAALSPEALPVYLDFFTNAVSLGVLRNTVVLGLLVGACGTALGFLFAFVQTRLAVPGKRLLHVIALVPVVSPPFAVATAMHVLYGRNGAISRGVFGLEYDIYGLDGLVLALSLSLFPVAYLGLLGMMRGLDPALEEAAMNLGAGRWRTLRTVVLPLIVPGLMAPFLLLFVEAVADLANPLAIGGDYTVLASRAYMAINGDYDVTSASIYCVILLVPSILLYLAQRYWTARKVRATITGRPSGSVHLIGGWSRWPIAALAWLVGAVIVSLYGTVVLGAMTRTFGVDHTVTFDYLREVLLGAGQEAVLDTVTLAAVATPIAGLLGLIMAWLVVRQLRHGSGLLDFAGTLGVAVPGTVLGIGFFIAYRPDRYVGDWLVMPSLVGGGAMLGGAVCIVLAYVVRSLPAGQRTAVGALSQLHPQIEQASTDLGASPLRTFRKVTLPLIQPALLTGLSYSFARCMTSVSTIVLLVTPDTQIITSKVLSAVLNGRYGVSFAYCTVLIAVVLAAFAVIRIIVGGRAKLHRIANPAERSQR